MIAAYPEQPSVRAGESLVLRVAADVSRLHVFFVRCGKHTIVMPEHRFRTLDVHASWQRFHFEIPADWPSGVYVAVFGTDDAIPQRIDGRDARALFVVRAAHPSARVLYNIPIFTYHAYNVGLDDATEGTCLYNGAPSVTLQRPGGGIGGHVWSESHIDVYDPSSPRQSFIHWDLRAIQWLEARVPVDYCCDLDLHDGAAALEQYALLIAFGHHEYWSDAMRRSLENHLERGGNAAFFTGNTCWFRIRYDAATTSFARVRGGWGNDPEERTFGVSYRYGGGKWQGGRPPSGFMVRDERHWAFDGAFVRNGDVFGDEERVVGYECDGAPEHDGGSLHTLADASIAHWPVADGSGEINNGGRATLGIVESNGSLFIAGSVDWPRVLASGEPTVERITENVLRRFSRAG